MGYQERDYYRDDAPDDPLGLRAMSVTAKLIVLTVLVFLVDLFFGGPEHRITKALALWPEVWVKPWYFFQVLTYGFVHSSTNVQHILGNMIGLWVFGRLLEEKQGGAYLVRYYLASIMICGLAWAARHYFLLHEMGPLLGASGGVTAVIILFCLKNPRATMLDKVLIPVPAWILGALIVLADLFGVQMGPKEEGSRVAFDVHLTGAAFAVLVWALKINFGRGTFLDSPGRWLKNLRNRFKSRPALRVHSEPHEGDDDEDVLEREGDRILAKISQHGDASLTAKERRTLEQYSRLMRAKRK
ncbi:intramembrane serine protease GlpG [Anatilimnocola aggregata]|uniref:Intramembrane serine protease GlpG n=1 Tax=Anatilimnocola aggregata TaxID=2528021 RepID=A0A517YBX7_9BACT|nr:rhomboid family intramembrane serine protease [Anatilimnocola aggregata]QDU27679.1 intramembrane serine protease GlpG [Anatilimnocola aggregata]